MPPSAFTAPRTVGAAESVAANLILPLADFFTPAHVERIVEAIIANSQIHDAHGTPNQVAELFRRTDRIHPSAAPYWEGLAQGLLEAIREEIVVLQGFTARTISAPLGAPGFQGIFRAEAIRKDSLLDHGKTYSQLNSAMEEAGMALPKRRKRKAEDD